APTAPPAARPISPPGPAPTVPSASGSSTPPRSSRPSARPSPAPARPWAPSWAPQRGPPAGPWPGAPEERRRAPERGRVVGPVRPGSDDPAPASASADHQPGDEEQEDGADDRRAAGCDC